MNANDQMCPACAEVGPNLHCGRDICPFKPRAAAPVESPSAAPAEPVGLQGGSADVVESPAAAEPVPPVSQTPAAAATPPAEPPPPTAPPPQVLAVVEAASGVLLAFSAAHAPDAPFTPALRADLVRALAAALVRAPDAG